MPRVKTTEEASRRWVENSIQANPDRIHGIVKAYFRGRQSLKWAAGLLKSEDEKLVRATVDAFKKVDSVKYDALSQALTQK